MAEGEEEGDFENELESDFLPILSAVYDPLLNHCRQMYKLPEELGMDDSPED